MENEGISEQKCYQLLGDMELVNSDGEYIWEEHLEEEDVVIEQEEELVVILPEDLMTEIEVTHQSAKRNAQMGEIKRLCASLIQRSREFYSSII